MKKQGIRKRMKLLVLLLLCSMLLPGTFNVKVQAAAMSRSKAISLYDKTVINNWAKKGYKKKITDDIRNNGCWTNYNDVGKSVSLSPLYYGSRVKYIYRDLDLDGTVEALFFTNGVTFIFTIRSGKVKTLGVVRSCYSNTPATITFNKSKKTFTFSELLTVRSFTAKVFRIKSGKLNRVTIMADYVPPADPSYSNSYQCWLNKKTASVSKFNEYKRVFVTSATKLTWGP